MFRARIFRGNFRPKPKWAGQMGHGQKGRPNGPGPNGPARWAGQTGQGQTGRPNGPGPTLDFHAKLFPTTVACVFSRQDASALLVLTQNRKLLGPWRHLDSFKSPPNGASASYLLPGRHDSSPHVRKGLNRDGDLGEK